MKVKTRDYGERARAVVQTRFPLERFWHPWRDNVDLDFDFDLDIKIYEPTKVHFGVPGGQSQLREIRDLLMARRYASGDGSTSQPNKRIVVIRDMHPRVLELLGVLLEIPPEFFLAHCEELATLSVVDEHYATNRGLTYWKVSVPRAYRIPDDHAITTSKEQIYSIKMGNVNRGYAYLPTRYISFSSFVSYWAKCYGEGSWTSWSQTFQVSITVNPADHTL
jgi:hypothetical protein